MAQGLFLQAWMADRSSASAAYFMGLSILSRRGAFIGWKWVESLPAFTMTDVERADLLTLRARIAGSFRDFEAAGKLLDEAASLGVNRAWVLCERSSVLEMEDRYEEALASAMLSLEVNPGYRPAVQRAAHLLQLVNRDGDAIELLRMETARNESAPCVGQLSYILAEQEDLRGAIAEWERYRLRLCIFEKAEMAGWEARMAFLQYRARNFEGASKHARASGIEPWSTEFTRRLVSAEADAVRVTLPVGFVRQHHLTCAPATLAAIAAYARKPVDHIALAGELTYDGTPAHVERAWAERNGFLATEFTITWEAACSLIDRNIPFTLTTVEASTAHLQAVIGYDTVSRSLVIRDPYRRESADFDWEYLRERYSAFGPRGMLLVPLAAAASIDGIDLQDVAQFDAYYALRRALDEHRREEAQSHLDRLQAMDGQHRIALFAERDLAFYDGSPSRQMAATDALLARYPKTYALLNSRIHELQQLSQQEECVRFMQQLAREDEPEFWRAWAQHLARDGRRRNEAGRFLLSAMRRRQPDAGCLMAYADLLWDWRQRDRSIALRRFAACLQETADAPTRSYFLAARHLRQTEKALEWVRARHARHGKKSSRPARLLFWALQTLLRAEEAFAILEEALHQRPDDGELLLFSADAFGRHGKILRSRQLQSRAETRAPRLAWLRNAAALSEYACDREHAHQRWLEILELDPLAPDAQEAVARFIAARSGREATIEYVDRMAERSPRHIPLARLRVGLARESRAQQWEEAARRAIELDPLDAWARREMALALRALARLDEALAEADAAVQIDTESPSSHGIRGSLLRALHREADARTALYEAIRLSVDYSPAIAELAQIGGERDDRRAAAAYIQGELERQVVFGEGLQAFRTHFFGVLAPAELLNVMREAHGVRPDLWEAWSCLIGQLLDMKSWDEALQLASECVARFPLLAGAWIDLATVQRFRGERDLEIETLQQAISLNPAATHAARLLASAYSAKGLFEEARKTLDRAVAAQPMEPANHGSLASLLWRRGERDAAMERVAIAIQHDPEYDWGWEALVNWGSETGRAGLAMDLARTLAETRGGEPLAWMRLAQTLPSDDLEGKIAAYDRVLKLNPDSIDARDRKACLLANAGCYDEALAACSPNGSEAPSPTLRGRAAWIEAHRGDRGGALAKMRAVLAEYPDYSWGWTQVSEWCMQANDYRGALSAAEMMARLNPRSAIPLGYIGDAHLHAGDEDSAMAALGRAFDLDPHYGFAGYTLAECEIKTGRLEQARRTLDRLEMHLPGGTTRSLIVKHAAASRNSDAAVDAFRMLCLDQTADASTMKAASAALIEAGLRRKLDRTLRRVLGDPGIGAAAAVVAVERNIDNAAWFIGGPIRGMRVCTDPGRGARMVFLSKLAMPARAFRLKCYLAADRTALWHDMQTWGQTGWALYCATEWRMAIWWLRDWRKREGAEPWMLFNLALAYRGIGKQRESMAVHEYAVALKGDHTTALHRVWLALDYAMAGRVAEAAEQIACAALTEKSSAVHRGARALAAGIIETRSGTIAERKEALRRHRAILADPGIFTVLRSRLLRRQSSGAMRTMAIAAGEKYRALKPFRGVSAARPPYGVSAAWWIGAILLGCQALTRCSTENPPIQPKPDVGPRIEHRGVKAR